MLKSTFCNYTIDHDRTKEDAKKKQRKTKKAKSATTTTTTAAATIIVVIVVEKGPLSVVDMFSFSQWNAAAAAAVASCWGRWRPLDLVHFYYCYDDAAFVFL